MKWISTKVQLPPLLKRVLVSDGRTTYIDQINGGDNWVLSDNHPVYKWMPLPENNYKGVNNMKIFSTVIKVSKYGKTNGTPWCSYTDAFGYPRCGVVKGIFGELEKNTEYNVVIVVDETKKSTFVIPQTKKVCINEESEE